MNKSLIQTSLLFLFLLCGMQITEAQFDPSAGKPGSKALHADSSVFISWAKTCVVERGLYDCSDSTGLEASYGVDEDASGKADGAVVSLGDGGVATLTFKVPITNGPGADFAVFENSFSDTYLELAFVEVSSDGVRFVRFPSVSNTDTNIQVSSFGNIDPTKLYNLAGKYRAFYGTPFDLEELKDSADLNINHITHVRIIDVIGTLNDSFYTRDSKGNKVNDPYPTAFESGGFDIDAVGVIYNIENFSSARTIEVPALEFPNPVQINQSFMLSFFDDFSFKLFDINGRLILENSKFQRSHNLIVEQTGLFFIKWKTEKGSEHTSKLIVR